MANSYLSRTQTAGTRTKATFSAWVKRSKLGANQAIFGIYGAASDAGQIEIRFQSSGEGFHISGQATNWRRTNRAFRDANGWYHLVVAFDTTQSTADDRVKVYVNGVQETSFAASGNPSQNADLPFGLNGATCVVGCNYNGGSAGDYFEGYMSHVALVDGAALTPTTFGETDSTSGIWKFKSPTGVTWGTNGFHLKFENSGNLGLDSSGQTNNLTTNGNLKQSLDTPSNVYATMNPLLVPTSNPPTFSNANTTSESSSNGSSKWGGCTTLGMTTGKWYCEAKATVNASYSRNVIGITGDSANIARTNGSILNGTHSWGWYSENGSISGNGSANIETGTTYGTNDIVMVALDLDNNKLYFGKNGSWVYSGVPTSGSTGTGAISIIAASTTNDQAYFFGQNDDTGTSATSKFDWNFGNGFFGTTAITSAGSNGNGALFEYDCPTGYYALNTKNINTYG